MAGDDALESWAPRPLQQAFRALRHRNFRLFFVGQGTSLIGTWMQQVAMGWLVYRLTDSPLLLGLVGFAGQIPALFLSPIAGVLADHWSRFRMVLAMQALSMVQALAVAILVLTGAIEVWHILALALFLGVIGSVEIPARQALLVELVDGTEDLANAIALNASMFNAARLVGPAIAGFMIGLVGEGVVFLINAVSYLAVLAALLSMRLPARGISLRATGLFGHMRDGVDYALGYAPVRVMLAVVATVSLFGLPFTVLMPVFATDVLGGGPRTLGFLMSSAGLGALAGALYLASRSTVRGLGRLLGLAIALLGLGLIALSLSREVWLSVPILLVTSFGMMLTTASCNTVLQTIVDEAMRGRVISLYTTAFMGVMPFGSLLAGALATRIGAPGTVAIGAAACLARAALFARKLPQLREIVRPVYIEKGIIPEVAVGLRDASEANRR